MPFWWSNFARSKHIKTNKYGREIPEMLLAPWHSGPTLPCALRRWPWPLQTLGIPSSHPHHDPRAVAGAQSNTVLQYHPVSCRVAIEKTLKSNCFNLKVFVGKISCISSSVLVSITHDVSSTDACQMNESSCTGRPLLSKISRLRAGQFHN